MAAAAAAESGAGPEKLLAPALLGFFVYNPRLGPREGEVFCFQIQEEKKILFYYPNEAEKNEKIRNVGLCEAIVQFTRTFSPTKPAKSLHTQKNRQFFNEPEENFWMVMVVRNPVIEKHKDGKTVFEYQEEELLDKVYSSVLQQCYNMYKLFNGTFRKAMEDGGVRVLKERLEKFFHRAMSAAVCFMIDDSLPVAHNFAKPKSRHLNIYGNRSEKEPQFKFIYFNHMNLAEKSTIHLRRTSSFPLTSVHPDLMKILGDINNDFTR
ncbi:putative Vacuolar fusion protein [Naja naja]|nr:putative Vacuolar fusion protein [Naja naja]